MPHVPIQKKVATTARPASTSDADPQLPPALPYEQCWHALASERSGGRIAHTGTYVVCAVGGVVAEVSI